MVQQLEEEIAVKIMEKRGLLTDQESGVIYILKNGVYKMLSDNHLNNMIIDQFKESKVSYSRVKRNEVIDFIKTNTAITLQDCYDSTEGTINLLNGIYRFEERNGKNFEYRVDDYRDRHYYFSFLQFPIEYDPTAECPVIDRFIDDVFGVDKKELVYQFIGYLLLPHIKYQRALILVGSGKNGKSTFLDMLVRFLGKDNVSFIPLQDLNKDYTLVNLMNKTANIVSDIPSKELVDTGNFKRATTDTWLSGDMKYVQGYITFRNSCKLIFSCNKLPRTKDVSPAFFRRWLMLFCENIFEGEKQDVNMLEKITTKGELSGLLNRAISSIKLLKEANGFPNTEQEVQQDWEELSNPIAEFINRCCNRIKGRNTKSYDLFNAINSYRSNNGMDVLDNRKIGYWLRQHGILGIQRQEDDRWYTFYQDIEILPEYRVNKKEGLGDWID